MEMIQAKKKNIDFRYIYLNNLQIYRGRTQEGHHWFQMDRKYQPFNDLVVFVGRGRHFSMDTQSWLGLCYRKATPASPLPPPHLSGWAPPGIPCLWSHSESSHQSPWSSQGLQDTPEEGRQMKRRNFMRARRRIVASFLIIHCNVVCCFWETSITWI